MERQNCVTRKNLISKSVLTKGNLAVLNARRKLVQLNKPSSQMVRCCVSHLCTCEVNRAFGQFPTSPSRALPCLLFVLTAQ